MVLSSVKRGSAAVWLLASKLAEAQITVLAPMSEDEPFDLGIYVDGKFYRIQVKRAYKPNANKDGHNQGYCIPTRKVSPTGKGSRIYIYGPQHADFLAGIIMETGDVYLIPIEETVHSVSQITLAPANARYGNRKLDCSKYKNTLHLPGRAIRLVTEPVSKTDEDNTLGSSTLPSSANTPEALMLASQLNSTASLASIAKLHGVTKRTLLSWAEKLNVAVPERRPRRPVQSARPN